jgi:hypothetical protein
MEAEIIPSKVELDWNSSGEDENQKEVSAMAELQFI